MRVHLDFNSWKLNEGSVSADAFKRSLRVIKSLGFEVDKSTVWNEYSFAVECKFGEGEYKVRIYQPSSETRVTVRFYQRSAGSNYGPVAKNSTTDLKDITLAFSDDKGAENIFLKACLKALDEIPEMQVSDFPIKTQEKLGTWHKGRNLGIIESVNEAEKMPEAVDNMIIAKLKMITGVEWNNQRCMRSELNSIKRTSYTVRQIITEEKEAKEIAEKLKAYKVKSEISHHDTWDTKNPDELRSIRFWNVRVHASQIIKICDNGEKIGHELGIL